MGKWTREEIIRQILRREAAGLPLTPGGDNGVESTLYQAGSRVFGSWRNAVRSAGIAPDRAQAHDPWSPSRVGAAIRALARRRHPLRRAELKSRFGSLMQAARRIYGSWHNAVIAAGVDPLRFRQVVPWTRERIIEAVLTRALKNEPLGSTTVRPRSLAEAAVRIFGDWDSALAAAGLDPKQYRRRASRAAHAGPKESLVPHGRQHASRATESREASEKVDPNNDGQQNPGQRWSHAGVIQAILARLHGHEPMNAVAVRHHDKSLYSAARKRYGSWRAALLAAGLNPDEFCKRGGRPRSGQNTPATP